VNPTVLRNVESEINAAGNKVYTLEVYDDLTYNDGTPITARDYVFSLLLLSAPQIAEIGGVTTNTVHIAGWDEFSTGATPYFAGVRLLDAYRFSIEIRKEYLPFFFELGMLEAIPYPISVIAPGCEVADDGQGAYVRNSDVSIPPIFTANTLQKTILDPDTGYMSHPWVTSGPWELVSFDWDTRILRVRINERFKGNWEGQKPTIDNIVFKSVLPGTMMDELAASDVHLLNKVVAAQDITEGIEQVGGGETAMVNYSRLGLGFINFGTESGPTGSKAVRQAIAYAIDVPAFNLEFIEYYGMQVYGYYGIGQWMVEMLNGMRDLGDASEEAIAEWETLSLDGLNPYDVDFNQARRLLSEDGWTLNESGEPYIDGVDTVRAKRIDGELVPLRLKFAKMQDSLAADILEPPMVEALAQIGIAVESTTVPFVELLEHYYRQRERTYDMMYLATNFISIFDPYFVFNTRDEFQNHQNNSGLRDTELEALALDLRRTPPGAYLEYTKKWLTFQRAFNEKLPMLPLYSNIYFDFFTSKLQNYHPDSELYDWPVALLYATLAEPVEAPDEIGVAGGDAGVAVVTEDGTAESGTTENGTEENAPEEDDGVFDFVVVD
jgi:ABC-type transport system substrate-binding protein